MTTIQIYYKGEWNTVVTINGYVPDYAIIEMAMAIDADPCTPHENVAVVDSEADEVLWDACHADDYDEPADIDNDCGYDPYMGCFTDDC